MHLAADTAGPAHPSPRPSAATTAAAPTRTLSQLAMQAREPAQQRHPRQPQTSQNPGPSAATTAPAAARQQSALQHPAQSPQATTPSPRRMQLAVAITLGIAFAAVLGMTLPSMFGIGGTDWLVIATPFAQWIPAAAVLIAAGIAGLRMPLSRLWSIAPIRRMRGAGPWGTTMLLVVVAIVLVSVLHLGAAVVGGVVPWVADLSVLLIGAMVVPMLVVTSLSALGEEVAWRGFLWQAWRRRLGLAGTVALTSAVWVAWHVPLLAAYAVAGDMGWREVAASLVSLALGSVLLGLARERGGNVWPAVLGHGLMNSWLVFATSNLVGSTLRVADTTFWAFHVLGWLSWSVVLLGFGWVVARRRPRGAAPASV